MLLLLYRGGESILYKEKEKKRERETEREREDRWYMIPFLPWEIDVSAMSVEGNGVVKSGVERKPESWLQSGSSQELVHHAARIKGYYYTPPPKSFPTIR
jgi:hypothetical protein